jgi:hypothetical protein
MRNPGCPAQIVFFSTDFNDVNATKMSHIGGENRYFVLLPRNMNAVLLQKDTQEIRDFSNNEVDFDDNILNGIGPEHNEVGETLLQLATRDLCKYGALRASTRQKMQQFSLLTGDYLKKIRALVQKEDIESLEKIKELAVTPAPPDVDPPNEDDEEE